MLLLFNQVGKGRQMRDPKTAHKAACVCAAIFMLLIAFCLKADQSFGTKAGVQVMVDPRVELMSIIFRLAGNPEYSRGRVPSYIKDIDDYFGRYKNHPAVLTAVKLLERQGVSFDAVMSMAVHITDAADLKETSAARLHLLCSRICASMGSR